MIPYIFPSYWNKTEKERTSSSLKKRRGCCADVAARLPWWINRCFKYRGKGVQRERFCYPRIGSVCFKNQLLTLTNKLLQSKLQHRVSVSLVEVFVVLISPHMCRMWMKVALSFPSHLLKTMAKCMWQNYLFQVAAAKNENKNRYQKHMRHINKTHVTVSFLNDHICLQNELQPGRTHITLSTIYPLCINTSSNHSITTIVLSQLIIITIIPLKTNKQTKKITRILIDHISQKKRSSTLTTFHLTHQICPFSTSSVLKGPVLKGPWALPPLPPRRCFEHVSCWVKPGGLEPSPTTKRAKLNGRLGRERFLWQKNPVVLERKGTESASTKQLIVLLKMLDSMTQWAEIDV